MTTITTYHHGDLRAALLSAAQAKLATDGYEALSLRALARDIGVASSAPYAHFRSREALLLALVESGAARLRAVFGTIAEGDGTPDEKLAKAGRNYLAFAAAEPELMRLMYVSPITRERILLENAGRALAIFERLVSDVMDVVDPLRVRDVAIGCWSTLHGFAMLRLHNRLSPDLDADRTAEIVIDAAVRLARVGQQDMSEPPSPRSNKSA